LGSEFGLEKTMKKKTKMIFFIEAKKSEYVRTSTIEGMKKNSFLNFQRNEDKPKYLFLNH